MKGKKYDIGKVRWDLLHWDTIEGEAKVLTYGAVKYDPDNWKLVLRGPGGRRRYFSAMMRHLYASMRKGVIDPTILDPESGLPHVYHARCCLMFLCFNDSADKKEIASACRSSKV